MASAGKMSADDLKKNIASLHKFHAVEVEANGCGIKIDDTIKTSESTRSTLDMPLFNNKRADSGQKGNMEKQIEILHKFHEIEVRANSQ
mmetsp:Transcript_29429/g.41021  ORF Transcript_29429/g.41021 Transcript_29429/m.41021 type:complete len:89 (+) Transcript_29429:63-329(+)|eukprot:CAMPEP_0185251574 /NCGR_PEP_ID=MMETSP1359-20130426/952_1 /TAXON_ID=552665 /ORGANISM="Bigelowiella longifila, Strain CCMP242" /LENGTH=88 /DNA_ID=CAMNT_0027833523 /DNA_START=63 /DNA_END=329 /DNA_ORIENTATION=-